MESLVFSKILCCCCHWNPVGPSRRQGLIGSWVNMSHTCVLGSEHVVNIVDPLPIDLLLVSEGKSPQVRAPKVECYPGLSFSMIQVTHLRQLGARRTISRDTTV